MFLKNQKSFVLTLKRFKTIYALSSGTLPSAIAILRISGPSTFTGEDCAELYLHGSKATLDAVFRTLAQIPGLESAKAGEAFYNGKFNLAQVEALSDLLKSETETQRRLFLRQNEIGKYLEPLRAQLINLITRFEAGIDFAEDVEDMHIENLKEETNKLHEKLSKLLRSAERGCLIRTGINIALIGNTNVGKSSLLNRLAEKDIAMVSNISGTTRDSIDLRIQLNSMLVNITDTAGIRKTEDVLEKEGIRHAHILVLILDITQSPNKDEITKEIQSILQRTEYKEDAQKLVICINKSDLVKPNERIPIEKEIRKLYPCIVWSNCVEDSGLKDFVGLLEQTVQNLSHVDEDGTELLLSRNRHVELLKKAIHSLEAVQNEIVIEPMDAALIAQNLRNCAEHIGEIAGKIVNEQILDNIFSQFCIGK